MEQELKEFGLTGNEAKIYIALLRAGARTPSELAESTGFSRSYVYDALERLQEKQVVSSAFVNGKKSFSAASPKRLLELARQRLGKINALVPELEKLYGEKGGEIRVELYKGNYVYKTLLRDITSLVGGNEEVLIFGIDDSALMRLDPHYRAYVELYFSKTRRKRIKETVILREGSKVLKGPKNTRYRFLPKELVGNTAFEVYANKVAIFLWGKPNHLILVENQEVADSYRKQFGILWKRAKKKTPEFIAGGNSRPQSSNPKTLNIPDWGNKEGVGFGKGNRI